MSSGSSVLTRSAGKSGRPDQAAEITRAASKQTYYTVRFLVDRDRVADAYRAYAYFRWADDRIDVDARPTAEIVAFIDRQQSLLEAGYQGNMPVDLSAEEQLLADMIGHDGEANSGLQSYLRHMMAVIAFDVERRGRTISEAELNEYMQLLATAVTEALLYFIGHDSQAPRGDSRYQAVRGAHIVHLLRDTVEDNAVGYFNIPGEYLVTHGISAGDLDTQPYREWVGSRVKLARHCFAEGREYLAQVKNRRCRLAGCAYIARFEWMARVIERDGYRLRADYPERKSPAAGLWIAWRTLTSIAGLRGPDSRARQSTVESFQQEEL